jgi:hypothetical protein
MIWVKHFEMEMERGNPATRKRLETRVLVRNATGSYGVSYRWNDEGTEAVLAPDEGVTFDLPILVDGATTHQTWEIPARSSCMLCHTPVAGYALGFNSRQLDRPVTLNGVQGNQIDLLQLAGYLSGPAPSPATIPAFLPASHPTTTLEFRVRSYLAANCVQCHQAGGAAPSSWDARPQLTLEETGLINGVAERGGIDPLDRLIVPGAPGHSILLKRLQASGGFTRMPPVGSHVLDQESIDLITNWIANELPSRPIYEKWRSQYFAPADPLGDRDADPDHDGISNEGEFLAGTSPLVSNSPWQAAVTPSSLGFLRKAHRGYLVETSSDLKDWFLWDTPGNFLHYSASDESVQLPIGPPAVPAAYFRVRISDP